MIEEPSMTIPPAGFDRQERVGRQQHGDDTPAALTRRQAQQCAAIAAAYRRGHTGYAQALDDVGEFLLSAGLLGNNTDPEALARHARLWAAVDAWPWPRPGAPLPQHH